jgi:hypothetical protein
LNASARFSESLADVMKKMLLISQVAGLAAEIETDSACMDMQLPDSSEAFGCKRKYLHGVDYVEDFTSKAFGLNDEKGIDSTRKDPLTGSLHSSEKLKLMQLLGQWEEPDRLSDRNLVRPPCL